MTSTQNKGLFQRAVIMSGIATELYPKVRVPSVRSTLKDAEQAGVEFSASWAYLPWLRRDNWMLNISVTKHSNTKASGEPSSTNNSV